VVERFLLKVLQASTANCLEVCAVNRINGAMGSIRIGQLARSLDISPRQLNRRFLQVVGLSPKKFSAINRFQKALLFKHSGCSTGEVLAETGYYDQAHFIHDFQRYARSSPEQVFSRDGRDVDTPLMKQFNPVNRERNMTHFYNTLYLQ
jgi:AraC-like DNA-binding protein